VDALGERALKLVHERRIPVGPRLEERELASFEQEHAIDLPADYRWFLQAVGGCCIGPPNAGLLPLDVPWNLWGERAEWTALPSLAKPFPFTQTCVWGGDERSWDYWVENVWAGSLFLGSNGCVQGYNLIVAGPEYGHVWEFTQFGVYVSDQRRRFLEWFVRWAEAVSEPWLAACRRRCHTPLRGELRRRGWKLAYTDATD
jgi:hypothetical protein